MNNTKFETFGISADILKSLARMGFKTATPVQEKAIAPFLNGDDIIVQAPTGTGKTGSFGIPIIQKLDTKAGSAQVLILSPTRELALQITSVLKELAFYKQGIRIATIYGGESIHKQFAALRRRPQIIVATPGRLMDHMKRRTVKLRDVSTIVLDEADRMLDMGFRPDLDEILLGVPEERQTVLFSATLSKEIMEIAKEYQQDATTIKIKQKSLAVDSVKHFYTEVRTGDKNIKLLSLLKREEYARSLVFVNTKRLADKLSSQLRKDGFRADCLHGDMRQQQRDRVMKQYRNGELDVLVATDVAARGIDVSNIDVVINYDIPQDSECYVHRIGRTGRANQNGVAHTLIYRQERNKLHILMRNVKTVFLSTEKMRTRKKLNQIL